MLKKAMEINGFSGRFMENLWILVVLNGNQRNKMELYYTNETC